MNKEEYLKQLENCIMALPAAEQKEALDYYRSFFDEAEDDQKAIDELGSPEKLAESIKEKFACVPEKKENAKKSEGKSDEGFFVLARNMALGNVSAYSIRLRQLQ